MPHPNGGQGNAFPVIHSFRDAFAKLESGDFAFKSNTGENVMHGNVCSACWGYRISCTNRRIGHAVEAFDNALSD